MDDAVLVFPHPERSEASSKGAPLPVQREYVMDEATDIRRKRLLYQSAHRGTKESDLLMGAFAAAHLAAFDHTQLARYEALLQESDVDLLDWIYGRAAPPPEKMTDVLAALLSFRYPGPP